MRGSLEEAFPWDMTSRRSLEEEAVRLEGVAGSWMARARAGGGVHTWGLRTPHPAAVPRLGFAASPVGWPLGAEAGGCRTSRPPGPPR